MRLLALSISLALITAAPVAHAKKKKNGHKSAAAAPAQDGGYAPAKPAKHHARFVGGGTGGDSPKPETSAPELLLTFDDGPALANTPKVLELLDKHGYKAVFFVCGVHFQGKSAAAEKARALLRDMVARGHAVGNHTIHHLFLCSKTGGAKAVDEIEGNGRLIAEALGEPPYLFRTPFGAHCNALDETLKTIGVRPIGWDIDPQDWRLKDAAKIEAAVKQSLRNLSGRAILLLHDVQPATIVALPKILDFIDEENARRQKVGMTPIKVIDYQYLLEGRPSKSPFIDALAQAAIEAALPVLQKLGVPTPPVPAPQAPPPPTPPDLKQP